MQAVFFTLKIYDKQSNLNNLQTRAVFYGDPENGCRFWGEEAQAERWKFCDNKTEIKRLRCWRPAAYCKQFFLRSKYDKQLNLNNLQTRAVLIY